MGQYHWIVNLDKKEYLHPHTFGDGLKLMEFGPSGDGTMAALALLLSCSNGRGGGDCFIESKYVGRWAGDRIKIIGDYADKEEEGLGAWKEDSGFTNISHDVKREFIWRKGADGINFGRSS